MSDSFSEIPKEQLVSYHKIYLKHPPIRNVVSKTTRVPLFEVKDKFIGWALIDSCEEDKVLPFRFHQKKRKGKSSCYAISCKNVRMHHIIVGKPEGKLVIDHIDNDTFNNTRKNLHPVTRSQNCQNIAKKESCSSKYKGVTTRSPGIFIAQVYLNGVNKNLGTFKDELHAARVRDAYAINHYGIHASTNDLFTNEMKEWIVANGIPDEYKMVEKPERTLPTNISLNRKKYRFHCRRNGVATDKSFRTLEEAVKFKEEFLQNHEQKRQNDEIERLKNPTKNSVGQFIIKVHSSGNEIDVIVDEDLWSEISKYNWTVINEHYYMATIDGKHVRMHVYVYKKHFSDIPEDMTIDHIEPDFKFDNRIANLRPADASLQSHNRSKFSNCDPLNKYRGVYFNGISFFVEIGKFKYCGFKIEEEAAEKANQIYTMIYGTSARLNVIDKTKVTTADDKIKDEDITIEYIKNIKTCFGLRAVIMKKRLNFYSGGTIRMWEIKNDTFEAMKKEVISLLFPE